MMDVFRVRRDVKVPMLVCTFSRLCGVMFMV
jgi:hypothetical protein